MKEHLESLLNAIDGYKLDSLSVSDKLKETLTVLSGRYDLRCGSLLIARSSELPEGCFASLVISTKTGPSNPLIVRRSDTGALRFYESDGWSPRLLKRFLKDHCDCAFTVFVADELLYYTPNTDSLDMIKLTNSCKIVGRD